MSPVGPGPVGLSAISLVNYACKGLCVTRLPFTWRTWGGGVSRWSTTQLLWVVCKEKGKEAYSSSWNSPQNYRTPLVNEITQCYLPPDRGDRPAFTPTGQLGTRFIDPVRMKGWVGLVGWLHTEMVHPSTDVTHPGTNRVRRSATTLIEANALPLSQTANRSKSIFAHDFPVIYT